MFDLTQNLLFKLNVSDWRDVKSGFRVQISGGENQQQEFKDEIREGNVSQESGAAALISLNHY